MMGGDIVSGNMSTATFWLIFSSSLIGFGYMIISKILEHRKGDNEDEKTEENNEQQENTE